MPTASWLVLPCCVRLWRHARCRWICREQPCPQPCARTNADRCVDCPHGYVHRLRRSFSPVWCSCGTLWPDCSSSISIQRARAG
uniref:Putative secreted protein n=1 Tax=Anopheles darlingi TaxID=43151 RepID=A0A2M4DK99_ANODA